MEVQNVGMNELINSCNQIYKTDFIDEFLYECENENLHLVKYTFTFYDVGNQLIRNIQITGACMPVFIRTSKMSINQ